MSKLPSDQLKSLYWAEIHIREALRMCEHLMTMDMGKTSEELQHSLFTGLVVSYARSFGENNGLSKLPRKFEHFEDLLLREIHDYLMNARNEIYAHKDLASEQRRFPTSPIAQIEIDISREGEAYWLVQRPGIHPEFLPKLKQLCEFQCGRLNEASTKMLVRFCGAKTFPPGRYILGETFP